MTSTRPVWGADCPISMPLPSGEQVVVPMFGFGMTQFRLVHDITEAEYEELGTPVYAPQPGGLPVIPDDASLDQPHGVPRELSSVLVPAPAAAAPEAVRIGPPVISPLAVGLPPTRFIPVVTVYGQNGTFGTMTSSKVTPSGHTLATAAISGWGLGAGLCFFYCTLLSDGQIAISTLPFTQDEILPTMNHAELAIFDPNRKIFYTNVIPTSKGATIVTGGTHGFGGTDVGAGDLRQVYVSGTEKLMTTQGGYYLGWDIGLYGLYPVIAYFAKDSNGNWSYDAAASLTGDQWEQTNSALYDSVIAGGQGKSSGNNGTYWPTRSAGQMAVLPISGRTVIGHYFGIGSSTSGAISVTNSAGHLLASYQIPNITPTSGPAITTAAVRDVEVDPSSSRNDERFVIIYDQFPNTQQRCFQEFSYNESTKTIRPVSVPCCPADTRSGSPSNLDPSFCIFDADGTLYISCSNGLGSANMSVYLKHAGGRNTVLNAPVTPTWPTTSWPTPLIPDYSLGFPVQEGLGGLSGPMAVDPGTRAVLVPGGSGKFSAAVPVASALAGNLISVSQSGVEPDNVLTPDDSTFATSLGSWVPFLGVLSRVTPPVAPPAGTSAMQITPGLGFEIVNTGLYPVIPGHAYETWINVLSGSVGRTAEVWLQFFKADGGTTSTIGAHSSAADNSASWTRIKASATADSAARFVKIFVQFDSGAEAHFIAANSLYSMSPADLGWSGFVTNAVITSSQALDGSFSLQITAPFANEQLAVLGPQFQAIPYHEYLNKVSYKGSTGTRTGSTSIRWFDAGGNFISDSLGTMNTSFTSSGWTECWCGAMAPSNAATGLVILRPSTVNVGENVFADRITVQEQPYTAIPSVDYMLSTIRSIRSSDTVGIGRPLQSGRQLYIPLSVFFGSAETAIYNGGTYVSQTKPQFLVCIDLHQILTIPGLKVV